MGANGGTHGRSAGGEGAPDGRDMPANKSYAVFGA